MTHFKQRRQWRHKKIKNGGVYVFKTLYVLVHCSIKIVMYYLLTWRLTHRHCNIFYYYICIYNITLWHNRKLTSLWHNLMNYFLFKLTNHHASTSLDSLALSREISFSSKLFCKPSFSAKSGRRSAPSSTIRHEINEKQFVQAHA